MLIKNTQRIIEFNHDEALQIQCCKLIEGACLGFLTWKHLENKNMDIQM